MKKRLALAAGLRGEVSLPLRLAWMCLIALIATWPLLGTAASTNDFRDEVVLRHYEEAAVDTVLRYGQWSLWDPYYCGGTYLVGSPQTRSVSPTFLFSLALGSGRSQSVIAFLLIVLGMEGAWRYLTARGALPVVSLLTAPLFALNGVFAAAPIYGWTNFFGFEMLPWALLATRWTAHGERRGLIALPMTMAFVIGFGGTYAAPMIALAMAAEMVTCLVAFFPDRTKAFTALGAWAVAGLLTVSLAAVRLWPIWETLRMSPRIMGGAPGNKAAVLAAHWLGDAEVFRAHWSSNSGPLLVGVFIVPAVVLSLTTRKVVSSLVTAALSVWCAAGYAIKPSLFGWLRALPVYSTFRYPERFLILASLYLVVMASLGVTAVMGRRSTWWRVVLVVATLGLVVDVGVLIWNFHLASAERSLVAQPDRHEQEFHQARGNRWALGNFEPMNRGSLSCWDAYPVPQSPLLRADLKSEEYLAEPAAGTLKRSFWSPNRLDLDVDLQRSSRVMINQNWHPGWKSNVGNVVDDDGLLAVDLPAGHHELVLRFRPRSALGGAAVSLASLLAMVGVFSSPDWRRKRLAIVMGTLMPLFLWFSLAIFWTEPSSACLGARAVTAERVLSPLPESAVGHARAMVGPCAVVGTQTDIAGDSLKLEIDWRCDERLSRTAEVFVHADSKSGKHLVLDHDAFSGAVPLGDAPAGRVLRDIIVQRVSPDESWTIWAGIWDRSTGNRLSVLGVGTTEVTDNRVLLYRAP